MQRNGLIAMRFMALASLPLAIGGCSSEQSTGSFLPNPDSILRRPDWATFSGAKSEFTLRPVTSEDLVSADGQCAFASAEQSVNPAASAGGAGGQTVALVPGGVALQMTECDVVRRAGTPEKVDVGADQPGDRSVVLTYTRGRLPGVYRFLGGRLSAIERAPGAPSVAAKPQKPPRTAKKPVT